MNRHILCIAGMILLAPGSIRAQGIVDGYPFDTPAEARATSMGESFVALPSNPSALMYNPAGLAGLQGITLSYSRRALNPVPLIDDMMCTSLTGTVAFPFGVLGLQYNRKLYGSFLVTTAENPDGGGVTTVSSYDVAVGFGASLTHGLALGVAAKYYSATFIGEPSYLFDCGLLYTLPVLHDRRVFNDSVSVGFSVQNIYTPRNYTVGSYTVEASLPEYFRLGVTYALSLAPRDASALTPLAFVVTGEYRNQLNADVNSPNGRAYWGGGWKQRCLNFFHSGEVPRSLHLPHSTERKTGPRTGTELG